MTTMGEAIDAFSKRYYGGKGEENLKETKGKLKVDPKQHDFNHINASKILAIDARDMDERFQKMEEAGRIDELVGLKAEAIQHIYTYILSRVAKNKDIGSVDSMEKSASNYCKSITNRYKQHIENKDNENLPYSHIPAVQKLFEGYAEKMPELSDLMTSDDIKKYMKEAEKFFKYLKRKHPECIDDIRVDYNKLFALEIDEFVEKPTMVDRVKRFANARGLGMAI